MRRAPGSFERARALVTPALERAAASLSPELRRLVEYHWGWTDAQGRPVGARGGKGLRPTLAILSAEAAGVPAEVGVAGAAAVEIVHDFTLLHDDVMDRDRERRGRPATWTVFGEGPALCAGDALALLAQRVLLRDASPARAEAALTLCEAAETVIAGQVQDLGMEGRTDVGVDAYLEMAAAKTGALLGCAASIGAILAGAPADQVTPLCDFGRALGNAFQAVDDWLGIWGRPERTGKPFASDLRRRKSSLPIVLALATGGQPAATLEAWMRGGAQATPDAIAGLVAALEEAGAEAATRKLAATELARARKALAGAELAPAAAKELDELASFVVEREW